MGSAWPGGHAGFLAVAIATHAVIGYALGAVLFDEPRAGLVGGVVADLDLLFPAAWGWPLTHRGLTHAALAAGVAAAVGRRWGRPVAGAVGVGYVAHLLVDSTTLKGVPFAYPLSSESFGVVLGGHSGPATALLWVGSLALLWRWRRANSE